MAKRASEIMSRMVVCVTTDTNAMKAMAIMRDEGIRHLPVVDRGRLVGVLSDRDLIGADEGTRPVAELMSRTPLICGPNTTIGRLAQLMTQKRIDSLPIVSGERLVGIVTSVDLLELLITRGEPLSEVLPFDFNIREFRGSSLAVPTS